MKIAGVITEYNPFHNGHKYQLNEIRKRTNADYIIVAMSGNFLQRGIPSITDKYTRTEMALTNGADIVLEIPAVYACNSAELFAKGGVDILASTGVVSTLCFGAETNNLDKLQTTSKILVEENQLFKTTLNLFLSKGESFPKARELTLTKLCGASFNDILKTPNNILAIEYLKQIHGKDIIPCLIQRKGEGYHSNEMNSPLASASAIRNSLISGSDHTLISSTVPENVFDALMEFDKDYGFVFPDEISHILHYKLLEYYNRGYTGFMDCNEELSNKIRKNIYKYKSFSDFCSILKSKNFTYSRISRVLCHILLNFTTEDMTLCNSLTVAPYLRVLGFKKKSASLLKEIKKRASAPLITKMADAPDSISFLEKDIFASDIYNTIVASHNKNIIKNEFSHPIIIP